MKFFFILSLLLLYLPLAGKTNHPFTGTVSIEAGENAVNWEKTIFGAIIEKPEKEPERELPDDDRNDEAETVNIENNKELASVNEEEVDLSEIESEPVIMEDVDRKLVEVNVVNEKENDPRWGNYYGTTPDLSKIDHQKKSASSDVTETENYKLLKKEETAMFPIDIILYSQGGENYLPMINAGLKLSYWNLYSSLSIGTDFSGSLARPLGVNMFVGGFYRFWDISLNAALGYEKIWDFSEKGDFDNYSLGFKAGLNYHMLSWMSITAGGGLNYSIMKDAAFAEGKFAPMIFGGFEFSLIK